MGLLNSAKNLAIVGKNQVVVERLKKQKRTKSNLLLMYLLGGRPVTGATMISRFNIFSYRDAIFQLKKNGNEIRSKKVTDRKGINHTIWWLACYDEEWVLSREERIW